MPIRPENRKRYPRNWKAISAHIRSVRAKGRCECTGECGLHHDARCVELNGKPAQFAKGRVVLTVAHLDHTPENCEPENLLAMCQRCHLKYDAGHHAETRRMEKARRSGQLSLSLAPNDVDEA